MFRVGLCVKPLGDSSFQGLVCASSYLGTLLLFVCLCVKGFGVSWLGDPLVEETRS